MEKEDIIERLRYVLTYRTPDLLEEYLSDPSLSRIHHQAAVVWKLLSFLVEFC